MAHTTETVFSDFFLEQLGFIIGNKNYLVDCVGKLSTAINMKTITKKCRGRIKKQCTKPTDGTVTISAHVPYDVKIAIYNYTEHATGVYGYGTESLHPEIIVTALVKDEDGNLKYFAFPVAVADTNAINIDDDAEEVAMDEIEFGISVDDNEELMYQALAEDITATIANSWMSAFTQDLIAATA